MNKKWEEHNFGVPAEKVFCDRCKAEIDPSSKSEYCDECYWHFHCECGANLCEEEGSTPGDGFCIRCR